MSYEVPTVGRIVYFATAEHLPTLPAIVQGIGETTGRLLLVVCDVGSYTIARDTESRLYSDGPYEMESCIRTWVRVPHLSEARPHEPRWWWPREQA